LVEGGENRAERDLPANWGQGGGGLSEFAKKRGCGGRPRLEIKSLRRGVEKNLGIQPRKVLRRVWRRGKFCIVRWFGFYRRRCSEVFRR